jgi:hypothetical protein
MLDITDTICLLVVIVMTLKIGVLWYMVSCSLVEICCHIRGTLCFHHQAVIYVTVANKLSCMHFSRFDCVYFGPSKLLFPTDTAYE